jgi:hypothetical protein
LSAFELFRREFRGAQDSPVAEGNVSFSKTNWNVHISDAVPFESLKTGPGVEINCPCGR